MVRTLEINSFYSCGICCCSWLLIIMGLTDDEEGTIRNDCGFDDRR